MDLMGSLYFDLMGYLYFDFLYFDLMGIFKEGNEKQFFTFCLFLSLLNMSMYFFVKLYC